MNQQTIKTQADVSGPALFSGIEARLRFRPSEANTGIVFVRTDLPNPARISATAANLTPNQDRRTSIHDGTVSINTIEHVLAAVNGLGIDNILIELDAEEVPGGDSSAGPFTDALASAGIEQQQAEKKVFVIDTPIAVSQGEAMIAALPGEGDFLDILFDLDYSDLSKSVGRQVLAFRLYEDDFSARIAPARSFLLEEEARLFQSRGWGKHLTEKDFLVMGPDGPVDNELRFADEHVRHKIADLVGDLALLGRSLRGRIVAYRSGHSLNHQLVRKLTEQVVLRERAGALLREPSLDIRRIMRLLPHRYPFLMIDRVIELDGDRKGVGVKNVSINEPYFQGHYPGEPIMPGVMILEAMAQMSGILLSQRLEHTGKVAVLLSMDRAKMRRPVRPGDQLIIEAEALHVRSRTGHCKCRAMVGSVLAAEAEIKFMLVDAEPI
ncbi:MAG: UDP-3-O-acyl-N-acetylglucosamine deacetylase [Planctomycetota bacterium]|nr:UDP-3-O-acyl-N-acetylglucosamine deacetylase [Planctomycetota bacterium]